MGLRRLTPHPQVYRIFIESFYEITNTRLLTGNRKMTIKLTIITSAILTSSIAFGAAASSSEFRDLAYYPEYESAASDIDMLNAELGLDETADVAQPSEQQQNNEVIVEAAPVLAQPSASTQPVLTQIDETTVVFEQTSVTTTTAAPATAVTEAAVTAPKADVSDNTATTSIDIAQPFGIIAEEENLAFAEAAISDNELDEYRGAYTSETLNLSNLDAVLFNNQNKGGLTGSNSISENGLGNASGLISVIQNTGNNVIIQSSTILNVAFD